MALKYDSITGKIYEKADPEYSYGVAKPGEFTYEDAPTYTDKYAGQINDKMNEILNREDFSYDHTKDDTYKQYEKTYTREGDRAMRDTLAQVAARTGGMASSYAVSAAQQQNQYYQQQLADKIPELKQLAYDMYLSNIELQRGDLDILRGARQDDYGMFRDTLNDYYTNRDFAYGQHRDSVNDWYTDRDFDYGQYRDDISDQNYIAESLYGQNQDTIANARAARELALRQQSFDREATWRNEDLLRAAAGEDSAFDNDVVAVAASLGITNSQAKALKESGSKAYQDQLDKLGIYPDNGSGAGDKDGKGDTGSGGDYEGGITEVDRVYNSLPNLRGNPNEAAEMLHSLGLDNYTSGIMAPEKWQLQRNIYEQRGLGNSAVAAYDNYNEYLQHFVTSAILESGLDLQKAGLI